ncbi:MAG: type III pantothenate kinase [Candidatus Eisenbacteria bacterium]
MPLALDIGNSTAVLARFGEGEEVRRLGMVETSRLVRHPERTWARLAEMAEGVSGGGALSCVVPPLTSLATEALARLGGEEPVVAGPLMDHGLHLRYKRPAELGPDRIAGAVAGRAAADGGAVIVVDFGTATTFSAVSAEGEFLGGAIAAGVLTAAEAVARRGATLFEPDLRFTDRVIGRSTEECLRSGGLWGAVALADGMIERMKKEMGEALTIATGGLADLVAPRCGAVDLVDEDLTLKGLKLLYERNRKGCR